jgi:hypothetical protein
LGIEDAARLEQCFSGTKVILLSNLDRKTAAEHFSRLKKLGVVATLVKVPERQATPTDKDMADAVLLQKDKWDKARKAASKEKTRRAAVKRKAEEEEEARLKAELAALQEARRKKAEEEAEEERRQKAEQAAREKAEREEARRKAREEKQRKAEEARAKAAEEKRRKVEQAAREKAEREEARRKAEEEKQRKAEEARAAEEKRRQDEQAAREEAERDEARRRAEEDKERRAEEARIRAARAKAERRNAQRKAEEEKPPQVEEQKPGQKTARKQKARRTRGKRKRAQEIARRKRREEKHQREVEQARLRGLEAEQLAQRRAMEESAINRAAEELTRQPSLKPVDARVRTSLEVPKARRGSPGEKTGSRNRAGAANLYALQPFRNSAQVKARPAEAVARARRGTSWAALLLASLLVVMAVYISLPPIQPVTGARAVALMPGSGPLLLAGDQLLLHDRAGVNSGSISLESLGVTELSGPMRFGSEQELLAPGRLLDQQTGESRLLRCTLGNQVCTDFAPDLPAWRGGALTVHPSTGMAVLADTESGSLTLVDKDGAVMASADIEMTAQPVLRMDSGLLFMNSVAGSAISVLRYDQAAFGQQLDEILLLPAPALAAEQTRIRDFILAGEQWWVLMDNPDTGSSGLYRFDARWTYLGEARLDPGSQANQLVNWGEKVLALDPAQVAIQRFEARGGREANLVSRDLDQLVAEHRESTRLKALAWRFGMAALGVLALAFLAVAGLNHVRGLVYRSHPERGAPPIDDAAREVTWIAPLPDRRRRLRRAGLVYIALGLALMVLAIAAGVSALELAALLLALAGPAAALRLLHRNRVGHIGILGQELVLADHRGIYHMGRDARLRHRGSFLLLDDVVVFTGNRLLPAFDTRHVRGKIAAMTRSGIRVDRKTVMIKLLDGRHPLALGACAIAICLTLAAVLLAVQWW